MNILLLILYVVLIMLNLRVFQDGRYDKVLNILTSAVAIYFLCSAGVAFSDSYLGELDLASYRNEYENKNFLEREDFSMYYLFFYCNYLGQLLELSYSQWWLCMSAVSIIVIFLACKKHKFNYNLVLACFMAYYEIVFYSGLKFYYGFCLLFYAFGFLIKGEKKDKLLYVLFICLAGGFHMMYYMFLILLLTPKKNPERFVKTIIWASIIATVFMRLGDTVISFMKPFFDSFNNDHINTYIDEAVGNGFYIAIILELVMVNIPYQIRKRSYLLDGNNKYVDNFFYCVLLTLIFCPFYAVSLIFVRIITAFSMVVIAASSSVLPDTYTNRKLSMQLSLLMVVAYLSKQLILDFTIGNMSFFKNSIKPFFNL